RAETGRGKTNLGTTQLKIDVIAETATVGKNMVELPGLSQQTSGFLEVYAVSRSPVATSNVLTFELGESA
ncbi:MAG: hypothetical protein MI741_23560, partial [Rhodospirillales bacterium]|nr:hypothetical protein [Rhodospirillales bacterium]